MSMKYSAAGGGVNRARVFFEKDNGSSGGGNRGGSSEGAKTRGESADSSDDEASTKTASEFRPSDTVETDLNAYRSSIASGSYREEGDEESDPESLLQKLKEGKGMFDDVDPLETLEKGQFQDAELLDYDEDGNVIKDDDTEEEGEEAAGEDDEDEEEDGSDDADADDDAEDEDESEEEEESEEDADSDEDTDEDEEESESTGQGWLETALKEKSGKAKRFRFPANTPDEVKGATVLQTRNPDLSWPDAMRISRQKLGLPEEESAKGKAEDTGKADSEQAAKAAVKVRSEQEIQADLKAAKAERVNAKREMDVDAEVDADEKIEQLQEELTTSRQAQEAAARERDALIEAEVTKEEQWAQSRYPDFFKKDSEFNKTAGRILRQLEADDDPRAGSLKTVIQLTAAKLNVLPLDPTEKPASTSKTTIASKKTGKKRRAGSRARAEDPGNRSRNVQPAPGSSRSGIPAHGVTAADDGIPDDLDSYNDYVRTGQYKKLVK